MRADRVVDGWLVVDKPRGLSSNRVVQLVRRVMRGKVGHAGTLDPLATGVLPLALGEATKTVIYAMSDWKHYRFRIRWGVARDTDDCEGAIVRESTSRPTCAEIEAMLPRFTGTVWQAPPIYSAIKVNGRRAYALARAAMPPTLSHRPVQIAALRLISVPDRDHADFEAVVGKGTYIRALARDLAIALETVGHVVELRRLSLGPFNERQAISLDSIAECRHSLVDSGYLLPIEIVLEHIPALALTAAEATRLRCGQRVVLVDASERAHLDDLEEGTVVAAWHAHAVVALARIDKGGLRPARVINR